jgi:hypothetical protein
MSKITELEEKIKNHLFTGEQLSKELEALKLSAKEEEFKVGDYIVAEGAIPKGVRKITKCESINTTLNWSQPGDNAMVHSWDLKKVRKATKEEIESHLIKEANKRYPLGTKYIYNNKNHKVGGEFRVHEMSTGFYITDGHGGCVYEYGKWAEILPSHPQITINGYKAEFKEDYVVFGCAVISKDIFINLHGLKNTRYNGNKYLASVKIGIGEFTMAQIEEISKHYSK